MSQLTEIELKKLTKKQKDVYELAKNSTIEFQVFKEEDKFQLMGMNNKILIFIFRNGNIKLTPLGEEEQDISFTDRDTIKNYF